MVESLHTRCVIVGNKCHTNSILPERLKPRANVIIRVGLLVGSKRIININEQRANPLFQKELRRHLTIGAEHIIGR